MSVRQQKRRPPAIAQAEPDPSLKALAAFLERHCRTIALALILIGSVRIVATYTVFNHVFDEPAHIACGMEWLSQGSYRYETQHPPLARVAAALGPYLAGIRSQGTPPGSVLSMYTEGNAILSRDGRYDRTLALARLGILPFYWIACLVVYAWGKWYFNPSVAVVSVFLFSFLPPVLAHAGLATTDMAVAAFLGAAFLAALVWVERPTAFDAVLFGAATGLAALSKSSSLVFFPAIVIVALAWYCADERPGVRSVAVAVKQWIPTFGLAVITGFLLIWAGYRFSFGAVGFANLRLPAPEFYSGIQAVMQHNAEGHPTYLLGQRSHSGFWYFYPVVLAVKTPLAFLLLLAAGVVFQFRKALPFRRAWLPLAFAAGILAVALTSRINIGVRHILPVYIGFSVLAGAAAVRLLEMARTERWIRHVLLLLLLWFAGSSLWSHPDYLPYFNELAGSEPEKILVDSDLDWGQDVKRLVSRLRQAGASEVAFSPFLQGDLGEQLGLPRMLPVDALAPSPGWNAVSLSLWKQRRLGLYDEYPQVKLWPDRIETEPERVGKGILLWYFPPTGIPGR
ncbi:MAG: glycosyltransferase family 39 protein [Acidobacteriia bacterium]|nr:glycosyltransferase family 39 protein [Terriglobia bacterium]